MKPLRFLLLSVTVVGASLVPQVPSQASELVKLGRLLVTGKRAPVAPAAPAPVAAASGDEVKAPVPALRPVAEAGDRGTTASRAAEAVQDARDSSPTPVAVDRPAMEPKGLERGGMGGGAGVSSSASGERSALWSFSLSGLLRGV